MRGAGAAPGTSSARAARAPAMPHVFRNTLRERSSCMRGAAPPDRGRLALVHQPIVSGDRDPRGPPSPRHPDDGLPLIRPQRVDRVRLVRAVEPPAVITTHLRWDNHTTDAGQQLGGLAYDADEHLPRIRIHGRRPWY